MKKLFSPGLTLDWKIAVLVVASTLLLLIDFYQPMLVPWDKLAVAGRTIAPGWLAVPGKELDRTLLYLVIPLLITLLVFRENPARYGFTFGDWRTGLYLTLASVILVAPILLFVVQRSASMRTFYRPMLAGLPWTTFLNLFGWEFLFRGWLLFGFSRKFGPEALWLQAVPFALAHVGKPEIETLSTIFGGFAFGWVAWKTKSFFWPFLIHWFVSTFVILVAAGLHG